MKATPEQEEFFLQERSLRPGSVLPNGATLIAAKQGFRPERKIVLAVNLGAYEPYVTWVAEWDTRDKQWVTFNGGYHTNLDNAIIDYKERT